MKNLSIIVHTTQQQTLADILRKLELPVFSFIHIEEHRSQAENDLQLSARDKVVGYIPKVRMDAIVDDDDCNRILDEIRAAGFNGNNGVYWISPINDMGEL